MAPRRRDRRPAVAGSNSDRPDRSDQPVEEPRTARSSGNLLHLYSIVVVFFFLGSAYLIYRISPVQSVYGRGLVKPNVDYQEITRESTKVSRNRTHRHFPNPVLAYLTPWNSKGYEMAKLFGSKFTHLSPVWYDLKSEGKKLVLDGRHNADMGWISDLRRNGPTLVLPRIVLEAFPAELLQKKKQRSNAVDLIVTECKDMGYDGIVLESWSRWAGYGVLHDPELRSLALQFIENLGKALHSVSSTRNASHNLELVFVIPPPRSQNLAEHDFGPLDLQQLSDAVDGFSLMTYDFSGPQNPGPNAPLAWIRSSLQILLGGDTEGGVRNLARMIFVGINLYGNDFALSEGFEGGAITGRDYISLLERYKPAMQWEEKSGEHYFIYSDDNNVKHAVFYPSLMSISVRLDEVKAWGAGLSIWEIGQGLDYFFDLL